jgi:hypothetical protein
VIYVSDRAHVDVRLGALEFLLAHTSLALLQTSANIRLGRIFRC